MSKSRIARPRLGFIALPSMFPFRRCGKKGVLQEDVTESEAEEMENVADLYRLIQLLEQDEQALVFLYLENKSHKEIAEIMGISVSNVGTKIQRIKLKLRRLNNEERK